MLSLSLYNSLKYLYFKIIKFSLFKVLRDEVYLRHKKSQFLIYMNLTLLSRTNGEDLVTKIVTIQYLYDLPL